MRRHLTATWLALAFVIASSSSVTWAQAPASSKNARETRVPVGNASLYARTIGKGQPTIVLHGGPDFDHAYLLPDLDRLQDVLQLVYYDQRGRGLSAAGFQPQDVTLAS